MAVESTAARQARAVEGICELDGRLERLRGRYDRAVDAREAIVGAGAYAEIQAAVDERAALMSVAVPS